VTELDAICPTSKMGLLSSFFHPYFDDDDGGRDSGGNCVGAIHFVCFFCTGILFAS
jgi:hypothetical protein